MLTFSQWLESNVSHSIIDIEDYKYGLEKAKQETYDFTRANREKAAKLDTNKLFQDLQVALKDYPKLPLLMRVLATKNTRAILQMYGRLQDEYFSKRPYDQVREARRVARDIFTYMDSLSDESEEDELRSIDQSFANLLAQTVKNMEVIKQKIDEAITNIPRWNNSPVVIKPELSRDQAGSFVLEPETTAAIFVGKIPDLMVGFDETGKLEVDNVVDADEDDFFPNNSEKADYFSLINEIRNPGNSRKNKLITVYTARPVKDRQFYLQGGELPDKIYLTSTFDDAVGQANELKGSEPTRDVWRFRLNMNDLLLVNNAGKIKHYQLIASNVKPASAELVSKGQDNEYW